MDKILLGVAASTHPEGVKKALFLKMISSASKPVSKDEVTSILQLSSQWVANEDEFLHDMGLQIFKAWAKYNAATYEEYFCHRFLISALGETVTHPLQLVRFIGDCLKTLQLKRETAAKILRMRVIALCRGFPDIVVQAEICKLLLANQDCMPEASFVATLCQTLITNTGVVEIPVNEADLKLCMDFVCCVGKLLHVTWCTHPATIIPSLQHVFNIISAVTDDESWHPSLALGCLVQHIPMNVVEVVTKSAVNDASIGDARMTVALQRIIEWLVLPGVVNIDGWIITFLTSLASVHKFTILITVTVLTVETLLFRLSFPVCRESAFRVLSHMLLSFQHSPEAFHKIIGQVPELMEKLRREDSASSHGCLSRVAELMYCLMYHHAGYPELYDTLLEVLKDFSRPSEEVMARKWKQSAWTSHSGGLSVTLSSKFAPRSETGKTGLVNLGNTCYMNSVIQVLFMTSGFREDILSYALFNKQSVMYSLQLTFAFLANTQRAAYAPKEFLHSSRPPWFAPGCQQDCSEFLKYLLDRLDEEEKRWKKMVSNAAASLSSSLSMASLATAPSLPTDSSPSLSAPSATTESSNELYADKGDENMDIEPSTSSVDSSPFTLSSTTVSLTDTNKPVGHPTDQDVCIQSTQDIASCSDSPKRETRQIPSHEQRQSTLDICTVNTQVASKFRESIVEHYFGGKSVTHTRCLNCGTVSKRTETFFDLPLAFPGTEGRDNLLGGHFDTPAEERRSEKSEYATIELPQESRSVVGASAIIASVTPDHHGTSGSSPSQDTPPIAGFSAEESASKTSLEELLGHYLTPELLVKENRYHCDKCQSLQDAEKYVEIIKSPEILIVTLLRFSYDVKLQRRCKILEDVRYPQVLHLDVHADDSECSAHGNHGGPCTKRTRQNSVGTAHCSTERDGDTTAEYVLSAVIVHSGLSSESGHYYCYACEDAEQHAGMRQQISRAERSKENHDGKRPDVNGLPRKWLLFNDSRVTASKFESFGNVTQRFPRDTAYVLLYRKCRESVDDENSGIEAALGSVPSSSSSSSTMSTLLKEKQLRKDLQEAVNKDNSLYIQEREFEARTALQNKRPASAATPFFPRNFDDKNDPPGGCGLGGGGGGSGGLGLTTNRLVF